MEALDALYAKGPDPLASDDLSLRGEGDFEHIDPGQNADIEPYYERLNESERLQEAMSLADNASNVEEFIRGGR